MIRNAVPGDFAEITILMRDGINESVPYSKGELKHFSEFNDNHEYLKRVSASYDALLLVYESDSTVNASLLAYKKALPSECPFFENIKTLYIESIDVAVSIRKRGVATQLLKAAEVWAKDNGFDRIELDVYVENIRAKELYQKNGFIPKKETHIKIL